MKRILLILVFAGMCWASEPNLVSIEKDLVESIDTLGIQRKSLETKQYAGTIRDILAQRQIDVNDVRTQAEVVKVKAVTLVETAGYEGKKGEYIKSIIEKTRREQIELKGLGYVQEPNEPIQIKKPLEPKVIMDDVHYFSETDVLYRNASLLGAWEQIKSEPGFLPDVNDPNYIEESENMAMLDVLIWEMCGDS